LSVHDAIIEYIITIPDDKKRVIHPELSKFARWIGASNELSALRPSDISPYSETFGASASDTNKQRVAAVKDFLNYVKKKGYVDVSLAPHIRVRKPTLNAPRGNAMRRRNSEVQITQQGYDEMVNRLEQLRVETLRLADEIERAAASGDVRENSPLEAARENQGMVQAQINRLESTLKVATIIDESERVSDHVQIGSWVSLAKQGADITVDYQVVAANEANPLQNKISDISPLGSAILGGKIGDEVVVKAPAGVQKFTINAIF
jgi:transcription elongation factor GreA